jgi:hypothetical protein
MDASEILDADEVLDASEVLDAGEVPEASEVLAADFSLNPLDALRVREWITKKSGALLGWTLKKSGDLPPVHFWTYSVISGLLAYVPEGPLVKTSPSIWTSVASKQGLIYSPE